MDIYMPMSTTDRHNEIINTFIGDIIPLRKKKEVFALQSDCALVHLGQRYIPSFIELVDISKIIDIEKFVNSEIEHLEYIQPDFMLFKDNPYLKNSKGLRTAGQPDLVIEVWSEGNSERDKNFKRQLYSSSAITEYWYIEQDSNEVECYYGKDRLEPKDLRELLVSRGGIEFDLRYLAI